MNLVGEIAADVIAPNAEAVDHQGPRVENGRIVYADGTRQNLDTLTRAGLFGLTLQRKYNGLNFPRVAAVMAAEMIARADVGFATLWGLQDCADTVQQFGSDALKDKYLPRIYEGATCSMDLTEVLSYIIMGYLLLLDTLTQSHIQTIKHSDFMPSCRYFAQEAIGWATYSLAKVQA